MKILVAHNFYQQPGGEDEVFRAESEMLEARGHDVVRFTRHNDAIADMHPAALVPKTLWNRAIYRGFRALIRRERPDVAHFHNTFPLISPSAYYAAKAEATPVVQTLHNYRLLCANGYLFRDGGPCEDCVGKAFALPAVAHACYRDSRTASAVAVSLQALHRRLNTWRRKVDVLIALTDFARSRFVAGGLPPDRMVVKPHFVAPDPGPGEGSGGYALFAGRLSPEKGIETLLAAWRRVGNRLPLRVVGDGPMRPQVTKAVESGSGVEWLGRRSYGDVLDLMGDAVFVILPSQGYETFGRVAAEAFAKGTPVIASRLGAMAEIVDHRRTGLLFRPADPDDLAATVERALADRGEVARMRREARREFEAKYTADRNYRALMAIYERAMAANGKPRP